MSNNNDSSSGIGFSGLLAIVFIVLKLCHVIDWSWWWVLSPLWAGLAIALVLFIIYLGAKVINDVKPKRVIKSKWQQRMEQMKEQQEKLKNLNK